MSYHARNAIMGAVIFLALWLLSLAGCGPMARSVHENTLPKSGAHGKFPPVSRSRKISALPNQMPASRTKSFRISHALFEALELRAKALEYPSVTALIEGLCRYDCRTQCAHGVTKEWAKLAPEAQDALDEILLALVKAGKGMKAADVPKWDWRREG